MTKMDYKWRKDKRWLDWDEEKEMFVLKPDAPQELWDSYNNCMKTIERQAKSEARFI